MKPRILLVALSLIPLVLAACTTEPVKPAPVKEKGVEQGAPGAETAGAAEKGGPEGEAVTGAEKGPQSELLSQRAVHFAFDSSEIDDEARAIIEAHAAYLAAHPALKVRLEGNTDERGTREYNLALGERRAKAVARLMGVLGVSPDRITTVSYGEEKPVALEHNETAWRQNRRVDIKY